MHHGHPYAVQSAAFFVSLIPIVVLFTMMFGARFFEGIRRARKPAPPRPAIASLAAFSAPRRALTTTD